MTLLTPIQRFDYAFSTLCLCHRFNIPLAKISRIVSRTGDGHLYAMIGLLIWWGDQQQGGAFIFYGLLMFLIELPLYWLLKNSFKRSRPVSLPSFIKPSDRYSLPSGHTAAAFMMAALISSFYPSYSEMVWLWASCIGFSRVLLGVHYLSDIIAGALLGFACFELAGYIL
ncbi:MULTISPECIES: phosphatase PAP2 family protein [unclassified Photobacterium]|uniref:phosphatase PAP2 family protein n=1 Tax=unclassified Photobacterium TaxID=2628852 RepID=UPI000D17B90C|nr:MULTISPECIES: phosphatase PAP2 family protein [unclassified Photobacterium]PSV25298.1 phosphatase PAP2 family protein [Photobacterium sp. GB-56]PSV29564.1 phosphatase PAP2 family protein [Photobacterium sp. GB-72]PSV35946.1 phosphatase PAP2 family protein [Photobacterium sp. GB-27]PSV36042.1 phosphatase PAP2 family protein [Photobacterium sp. GB-210]PSV43266.1 phosphatase PAP2 family protein [Photobacterium sp. GB-36]